MNKIAVLVGIIVVGLGSMYARINSYKNETKVLQCKQVKSSSTHISRDTRDIIFGLDKQASQVSWQANYVLGGGHQGILEAESGIIIVSPEGELKIGNATLAMTTIQNLDLQAEEGRQDLENHLKSADFFATETYPTAKFVLTKVAPHFQLYEFSNTQQILVEGDLTIKGITQAVSFSATLTRKKDTVKIKAELKIDRTKWGINYKSYNLMDNIKDGVIANEITIGLNLVFKKGLKSGDGC